MPSFPYTIPLYFSSSANLATNPNTCDQLVASLKRRGLLPTSDSATTEDYLAFATEELRTYIQAFLLKMNEEYAVTFDYYVTTTADVQQYRIPPRATGDALRMVRFDDGTGIRTLTRYEPEHQDDPAGDGVDGYMLEGDVLTLLPGGAPGYLQMAYAARPNRCVLEAACGRIEGIDTLRTTITLTTSAPSTFVDGTALDVISGQPGFGTRMADVSVLSVDGPSVVLATALPTTVVPGDYLALSGESPIPQCPIECHSLLAQRVVVRCLEARGSDKAAIAEGTAQRLRTEIESLLSPRVKANSSRPILNPNAPGFFRRGYRWS